MGEGRGRREEVHRLGGEEVHRLGGERSTGWGGGGGGGGGRRSTGNRRVVICDMDNWKMGWVEGGVEGAGHQGLYLAKVSSTKHSH